MGFEGEVVAGKIALCYFSGVKAFGILLISMLLLFSCSVRSVTESRIAMDTLITVTVPENESEIADEIFSLIYRLDEELSSFNSESWVYRINENAGISPVSVPEDIYLLIKASIEMAYRTDGIFNPAIGPLSTLWAFGSENARVPSEEEIEAVLPLLDYRLVELSDEDSSVYLPLEGMALDLGGVGKGYASDRVRIMLDEKDSDGLIVNLGGNVLAYKSADGGRPWRIGIRNPEGNAETSVFTVEVENSTVITSGVYQRYIEEDGVRYHHILDYKTGYPFNSDIISATVISSSGTIGDMLSTTLLALGSERALEFASEMGVRCILILSDGTIIDSDSPDSQIAVMEE